MGGLQTQSGSEGLSQYRVYLLKVLIPPLAMMSSLSAILMTIIGVQCGHVLVHLEGHSKRLKHWMIKGLSLLSLGFVIHFHKCYLINGISAPSICNTVICFSELTWQGGLQSFKVLLLI